MSLSLLLPALCSSALLAWILRFKKLPNKIAGFSVLLLIILSFVPLNNLAIAAYIRGVFSDPSITTIIIACLSIGSLIKGKPIFAQRDYLPLFYFLPVFLLFFYPSSLGLSYFDPYSYGYQPYYLLIGLLAIAMLLWWKKYTLLLTIVLIDLWSFNLKVLSSNNLWDYLFDPLLLIYCLVQLALLGFGKKPV